jgi:Fe2+ or Zn2+ uptake regulation protein
VCGSCGRRQEVARPEIQPLADEVLLRHGFDVDIEHLTIEGRCGACRAAR